MVARAGVREYERAGRLAGLVALGLALATPASLADAEAEAEADAGEGAASAVAFELQDNARCHNLSPGGKMTFIRSTDPDRVLRVRLIRYFSDAPQPGRVDVVLSPGEEPREIGCNQLDGRPQEWRVERVKVQTGGNDGSTQ